MIIITQNRQAVWNFDDLSRMHVTGTGQGIQAVSKNGGGGEMARYASREKCTYVLGMFEAAVVANELSFVFPAETEIEHAIIHRSHVKTKVNRHGGS